MTDNDKKPSNVVAIPPDGWEVNVELTEGEKEYYRQNPLPCGVDVEPTFSHFEKG